MQQDFRQLAQRHMWLSWWWATAPVYIVCLLMLLDDWHEGIDKPNESFFAYSSHSVGENLVGLVGLLMLVALLLGLPTMLVGAVQLPVTQRIFASASSVLTLAARILLFSIGSVTLLWLTWILFDSFGTRILLPAQSVVLFFGLSLPWLLSSVGVAWWLGRRLFPR